MLQPAPPPVIPAAPPPVIPGPAVPASALPDLEDWAANKFPGTFGIEGYGRTGEQATPLICVNWES